MSENRDSCNQNKRRLKRSPVDTQMLPEIKNNL